MSQSEFAAMIGVTEKVVGHWEHGLAIQSRHMDDFMTLIALASGMDGWW